MSIDTNAIIPTLTSGIVIFLFTSIHSYVKGINKELVDARIREAEYKSLINNHQIEIRDIWTKISEVNRHLENTDKNLSKLNERTKNL